MSSKATRLALQADDVLTFKDIDALKAYVGASVGERVRAYRSNGTLTDFVVSDTTLPPNDINIIQGDGVVWEIPYSSPVKLAKFGVVEGEDIYPHIAAAIESCPDRQTLIGGHVYSASNSASIEFPATSEGGFFECSQKIKIPPNKNILLTTPWVNGCSVVYTGVGFFALEFQPGGAVRAIGYNNINFVNGGVAVVGGNSGWVTFDHPVVTNSPAEAFLFCDSAEYYDGPDGEYPLDENGDPTGYNGPNVGAGINTVHVIMNRPFTNFCDQGISVIASTTLEFLIHKPRLNATTNTPLRLSAVGVHVEQPDLQGVKNWETKPYIHIDPSVNDPAFITINLPRFGSERFPQANPEFFPAKNSILFGRDFIEFDENGDAINFVDGDRVNNITITNAKGFGSNTGESQSFIYEACRMVDCKFLDGNYRNFNDSIVNRAAQRAGAAFDSLDCLLRGSSYGANVAKTFNGVPENEAVGWINADERAYAKGDKPTVVVGTQAGSGGSVSVFGNANNGQIILTTGTGRSGTLIASVEFAEQFSGSVFPVLSAGDADAASVMTSIYTSGATVDGFDIRGTLADSTVYVFNYVVLDRI